MVASYKGWSAASLPAVPFVLLSFMLFFLFVPTLVSALSINKAVYAPSENVLVTCPSSNTVWLFDLTPGIDGAIENGGNIGQYNCGSPTSVSFTGVDGHSYALLEANPTGSCPTEGYDSCASQNFIEAEVAFTVSQGGGGGGEVASPLLQTDKSSYLPNGLVQVTCSYSRRHFELYDTTNGDNIGNFNCGSPASVSFSSVDGHSYSVLELDNTGSCVSEGYDSCRSQSFVKGEVFFTVSQSGGSGDGGSFAASLRTNKSYYIPGESLQVTCAYSQRHFSVYDTISGDNIGNSGCGSPATVSLSTQDGRVYAILELDNTGSCVSESYNSCRSQSFVKGEVFFTVSQTAIPGRMGVVTYDPEVTIFSPVEGAIFSHEGIIDYSAKDRNDLGNEEERTIFGLRANPVSIYYSDKIGEWDHLLIPAEDKVLIAKDLPAKGPYAWRIKGLVPGVFYRIVVDAVDKLNIIGQAVSGLFTVDFDAPTFTVRVDPPVTRKEPVTIIVDASKALVKAPVVTVTQRGGKPVAITMKGKNEHYEGVYAIQDGYDGIASVSVEGVDRAGNSGSTIVSGGNFAIGIDPPPKPRITFPRDGDVVATSTTAVFGTTREDTRIVLRVNGVDTYSATSSAEGTFVVPNVRLNKAENRGVNTISVAALDVVGTPSGETSVKVKFNVPPTLVLVRPKETDVLSAETALEVSAGDENKDPLLFTYELIAARDYDPALESAASATTSAAPTLPREKTGKRNEWVVIADGVPSSRFSWDSSEFEDGEYFLRAAAYDGTAKVYTVARRIRVHNTSPVFRFEDGRKTITGTTTALVVGRVFTPQDVSPRPVITKAEYSTDNGKSWSTIRFISGSSTPEARFSVTFSNLKEGVYGVLWRVKDSRGLFGLASHPILVDKTPPVPPLIMSPKVKTVLSDADDSNSSKSGFQIDISGTAEPQSTLELAVGSTILKGKTGVTGDFMFRDVDVIVRGPYTIQMRARDEAGNKSAASVRDFIYDNPPEISILNPKQFRALKGRSTVSWRMSDADNDQIQNVSLSYRRGGGAFKTLPIDTSKNSFEWDVSAFPEGRDYQIKLEASDGLTTSQRIVDFSIDTTPPSVSSLTLVNSAIGKGGVLEVQGSASDALSGIEFIEYALSDPENIQKEREWFTGLVTSGFLQQRATFSIKRGTNLVDGVYQLLVRGVDAAGNVSSEVSRDVTVDTIPPRIGSFGVMYKGVRISPDENGNISAYTHMPLMFEVSLEGDTEAASVAIGSATYALKKNLATGLWEASIETPGDAPIRISAEDAVHNKITGKEVGAFVPIDRGAVFILSGGQRSPVPDLGIKVLVLDEGTGNFVSLDPTAFSGIGESVMEEDGIYELVLPKGTYKLIAHAKGFRTIEREVQLPGPSFIGESFETEHISAVFGFIQSIMDYLKYGL